ncbi:cell division protein [Bifidobacterium tissieri]|uniref:Cell division protein n=1 Tax=Bifidobacterium tissieri TaxID=1630162 RepID=A0A261FFG3_9BIFI|nr:cell division protein FtsQ/DivIB [Bifidobacterium tissieri]OZG57818.1 cell division protein [Bifidobacterium tissieri]
MAGRVVSSSDSSQRGNGKQTSDRAGAHGSVAKRAPREASGVARSGAGDKGARSSRSVASAASRSSTSVNRSYGAGSGAGVRSKDGDFVDARTMKPRKSVSERLDSPDFGGPGLFARPKVVNFPERLKERRQAHRREMAVRIAIVVAVIAAVVALIWGLLFSPLLRLHTDQITVGGTNTWVSASEVADIAYAQQGKSLLLVDTDGMEEKISDLPGVTSAKAVKRYPHGLDVTVKAEIPAAVLQVSESDYTAVDREGRVLNAVNASVKGIPVIEVKDAKKSLDNKAVKQALQVLGSLDEPMRQKITKVEAKTQDSITTTLDDGYTIIWGNSSQMKLKKAVVDTLLSKPDQLEGAKTINVAAPDKATIK